MATYLYCVVTPPRNEEVPPGLAGIGGAPVRALFFGAASELVAWVATVDEAVLRATGQALTEQALLHNEIVNAAQATGRTPAPARYGSRFADDASCLADLNRRSAELSARLEQIADSLEMPVLLVPTDRAPAANALVLPMSGEPAAGKRYLESLRQRARDQEQQRAAADAEAARLGTAVGPYVRAEVRSMAPNGVMSIAYLVSIADLARFNDALAAFAPESVFRVLPGEKRAPYSFSDRGLGHGGHDSGNRR